MSNIIPHATGTGCKSWVTTLCSGAVSALQSCFLHWCTSISLGPGGIYPVMGFPATCLILAASSIKITPSSLPFWWVPIHQQSFNLRILFLTVNSFSFVSLSLIFFWIDPFVPERFCCLEACTIKLFLVWPLSFH